VAAKALKSVAAIKGCRAGQRVSFRARALRVWEIGGQRMALVGDESALTRIELGDANVERDRSYEFRDLLIREYPSASLRTGPGGWHSASMIEGSEADSLPEDVSVSQDETYIERTFKILSGVQRKKARQQGREPPWRHPGGTQPTGED
jgi:hypothetical protein